MMVFTIIFQDDKDEGEFANTTSGWWNSIW